MREFCGVKPFDLKARGPWLYAFAAEKAPTKDSTVDIINAMLKILVKECFELPAFSTLDRLAYRTRAATQNLAAFIEATRWLGERQR